jgi:hypothetical protein
VPNGPRIRLQADPACPALEVRCDLPDRDAAVLELYDAMGRRLARRELDGSRSTVTVKAGEGIALAPGMYWLRLSQRAHPADTRMVVVAR